MKKTFIAIMAVATIAACNKAEVVDLNQGEEIAFGNAFVDNVTKVFYGNQSGETPLAAFNVYGAVTDFEGNAIAIYSGDKVTGTIAENSVWQCEDQTKVQYWIKGAKYNFAALVDAGTVEPGEDKLPKSFTYTYTPEDPKDVLYARSAADIVGQESNNPKVAFSFGHMLSKVKFTLTNTSLNATDYTYKVSGIKITNAIQSGTCTVATKTWTSTATGETVFGALGTDVLMIPGAYEAKLEFTIDLYYKGSKITSTTYTGETAKTVAVNFKAGYAYNFNISVGVTDPIQFTVSTYPTWTDATSNPSVTL